MLNVLERRNMGPPPPPLFRGFYYSPNVLAKLIEVACFSRRLRCDFGLERTNWAGSLMSLGIWNQSTPAGRPPCHTRHSLR